MFLTGQEEIDNVVASLNEESKEGESQGRMGRRKKGRVIFNGAGQCIFSFFLFFLF